MDSSEKYFKHEIYIQAAKVPLYKGCRGILNRKRFYEMRKNLVAEEEFTRF
jgi:hypothetical protein